MEKIKLAWKAFIKHRWHLHSLTLVLAILFLGLTDLYPWFMQIGLCGNVFQIFLCLFVFALALPFLVEWVEGVLSGDEIQSEEVAFDSFWDKMVSAIACVVGIILYYIYFYKFFN